MSLFDMMAVLMAEPRSVRERGREREGAVEGQPTQPGTKEKSKIGVMADQWPNMNLNGRA